MKGKKRKGIYRRYEEAREAWAEKGGWLRYQVLRYRAWRLGRTAVSRLDREAEAEP
jgi:hypothetical protein